MESSIILRHLVIFKILTEIIIRIDLNNGRFPPIAFLRMNDIEPIV